MVGLSEPAVSARLTSKARNEANLRWLGKHDLGGEHAMFQNEEKLARCKCGQELRNLRSLPDSQTGTRFLTERCEICSEITLIREDDKEMAL
jgi:hypothetical protein